MVREKVWYKVWYWYKMFLVGIVLENVACCGYCSLIFYFCVVVIFVGSMVGRGEERMFWVEWGRFYVDYVEEGEFILFREWGSVKDFWMEDLYSYVCVLENDW